MHAQVRHLCRPSNHHHSSPLLSPNANCLAPQLIHSWGTSLEKPTTAGCAHGCQTLPAPPLLSSGRAVLEKRQTGHSTATQRWEVQWIHPRHWQVLSGEKSTNRNCKHSVSLWRTCPSGSSTPSCLKATLKTCLTAIPRGRVKKKKKGGACSHQVFL